MSHNTDKWTEKEHLPQWDEEFYHIYTAKKYGKWLMLKTLRPELKGIEEYEKMLDKEFEVRYNLAHSNIVMINDLEEVPGIGRCIITDDVYGDSMAALIKDGKFTEENLKKITVDLVNALDYIQSNHIVHHPIRPETIIFTENVGNLKVIDVGFDQKSHLTPASAAEDIEQYGKVLQAALNSLPTKHPDLQHVADKCKAHRYRDIQELRFALSDRNSSRLYILIISFLVIMIMLLLWIDLQ
ncbi:MAG: protein kinase [Muribaculaceae bacterium]|nr:protein kinase [Muribaculaceae bacterium]MDE6320881.1 protein kinase [Muribaculaceae bacterium]